MPKVNYSITMLLKLMLVMFCYVSVSQGLPETSGARVQWNQTVDTAAIKDKPLVDVFSFLSNQASKNIIACLPSGSQDTRFNPFNSSMSLQDLMDTVALATNSGWGMNRGQVTFFRVNNTQTSSGDDSLPNITRTRMNSLIQVLQAMSPNLREALRSGKAIPLSLLPAASLNLLQGAVERDGYFLTPPQVGILAVSLACAPNLAIHAPDAGETVDRYRFYVPLDEPTVSQDRPVSDEGNLFSNTPPKTTNGSNAVSPQPRAIQILQISPQKEIIQTFLQEGAKVSIQISGAAPLMTDLTKLVEQRSGHKIRVDPRVINVKLFITQKTWLAADLLAAIAGACNLQVRLVGNILFLTPYKSPAHDVLSEQWLSYLCQATAPAEIRQGTPFSMQDWLNARDVPLQRLQDRQKNYLNKLAQVVDVKKRNFLKVPNLLVRPALGPLIRLLYYVPIDNALEDADVVKSPDEKVAQYELKQVVPIPVYWDWETIPGN